MTEITIPVIFQPAMQADPYTTPYISLPGGRGSSKSHTVGVIAILRALQSPINILFAREFQNSIKDSSYQVLVNTIDNLKVAHLFTILKTEILAYNGSKISFKGLKTNISSIKSFEDVALCVVEEAENVSDDSWEALIPTIRAEGSQIIVIFNPKLKDSPTYKRWVTEPLPCTLVIHSTYKDNPFLSDKFLAEVAYLKETNPVAYRNIYLGEPISGDDQGVIKLEWFEAALDAHKKLNFKPEGRQAIGYDVSDGGADDAAIAHRHGSVIVGMQAFKALTLKDCVGRVYSYALTTGATDVIYDAVGLGVGARPYFELVDPSGKLKLTGFDSRQSASKDLYKGTHKGCDYFKNKRSEAIIKLADRFHNTYLARVKGEYIDPDNMVSIDTTLISDDIIDKLRFECTNIREKANTNFRTIESKQDMKARGLPSPNLLDGLYMCFNPIDKNPEVITLNFSNNW